MRSKPDEKRMCGGRGPEMGQRLRETAGTGMGGDEDWLTRVK